MSVDTAKDQNLTGHPTEPLALTSNDVPELNRMVNNCCIRGTDTRIFNPSLDLRHLTSVMYVFGALVSFGSYWLAMIFNEISTNFSHVNDLKQTHRSAN